LHSEFEKSSGCSAARLAHLLWEQRVAGSNPATPTNKKALHDYARLFYFSNNESSLSVFREIKKNLWNEVEKAFLLDSSSLSG
jgi:predicted hydrocarbon binding protein